MKAAKELLVSLLDYIGEQAKIIKPEGFQLSALTGFRHGPHDFAGLPGIHFNVNRDSSPVWLRIDRLESTHAPELPEFLESFVTVSPEPGSQPPSVMSPAVDAHLAATPDLDGEAFRIALAERFDAYASQWWGWAEREKPRRRVMDIYSGFFNLKHQIEAEETAKPQELVWGIGVASWHLTSPDNPVSFEYPILTQAMEIGLDEESMAIEVRPRDTDARVELAPIVAASVIGAAEVELSAKSFLAQAAAHDLSPFDPSSYTPILKLVASNLDANGVYKEVLATGESWPAPQDHLVVTDAWVLLARPRQNNFLFEDLKRLKAKIEASSDLPAGPLALVTPPSDERGSAETVRYRGLSTAGGGTSGLGATDKIHELYFPLPSNDEQITIIEQLERSSGVTVQGPPGTGKTHTIANVICHYLATGRRVLVTSRGEPALAVLQEKLPEEVKPLTVALLVSDREGIRQFQSSIEAIQHRVSQLNGRETLHQIETLQTAIDRTHGEIFTIDGRLDDIAGTQLGDIEVDGEKMRAQKAAEYLLEGQARHGWLTDELSLAAAHQVPLTEDDMAEVRQARRLLGKDLAYIGSTLPSADSLPLAAGIAVLHQSRVELKHLERTLAESPDLALKANTGEVMSVVGDLLKTIAIADSEMALLGEAAPGWWRQVRERCRDGSFGAERGAFEAMFSAIDELASARADFLKRPVVFPAEGFGLQKVNEAVKRASETGKPFGLLAMGAGDAKRVVSDVKVSGLPPDDAEAWAHVQRYVDVHVQLASFVARWNTFAEALSLPTLAEGSRDLRHIEMLGTSARRAHRLGTHLDKLMLHQASAVFNDVPAARLLGAREDLDGIRQGLGTVVARARLSHAAAELTLFQEQLAGASGEISEKLRDFAGHMLGREQHTVEQVTAEYVSLMAELRRVAGLASSLNVVIDAGRRLRESGAVHWAERVLRDAGAQAGEDIVVPAQWAKSWTWARLRGHLEAIEARHEIRELAARRLALSHGLQRLYSDLVAKCAWLQAKNNATPRILSALNGYATAVRKIGQGTGTNAARYRRDARDAMTDAAGAVPCWIMSHARISEAMPADIGTFDLVIVDEASQSDLWALPAILRGKKILVVGDDKQVSPDPGFIAAQHITSLRHRFLQDQPFAADMTPEKSLYDLAARVFAGNQVMLREHFRCVGPIISYSNAAFYGGSIRPLRIPTASERIDPPLVDVYVPGGVRDKKDRNRQEAEAIAEEIEAILVNPAMAGRTIGVVSLLGIEQAQYINEVVRGRCSATELLHRKFECGEARSFQGSERDIVFLSLVVDRDRHHALSGARYEQRFNVAASRARDRMYLMRSVELSQLSETDIRKSLLTHFSKPSVAAGAGQDDPLSLCESGFEKEVFTKLTEQGYRVIPQVKVGGFRIDMVVEGSDDRRLAIELDGDEFHGPDRWAHDMGRQRILERAGWTFWRCFASTWSLHKDDVFGELLERLRAMRIEPMGRLGQLSVMVEHRVWAPQPENEDAEVSEVIAQAIESSRTQQV
jgi:very-short-patch-repair endonuclease